MNDVPRWEEQQRWDRLVDGELTESEYRDLLASLDGESDGWRKCALAFLEAQAWRHELHELSVAEASTERLTPRQRPEGHLAGRILPLLAASAASFAIAFWLGTQYARDARADHWASARPTHADAVASQSDGDDPANVAQQNNVAGNPLEIPLLSADDEYARKLADQLATLPPHVEREIQRSGYTTRRQREWVPVELQDGQRAIFPVDQWEIVPVSKSSYQ